MNLFNEAKKNFLTVINSYRRMFARDKRNRKTYRYYKRELRKVCDDGQELERAKLMANARHDVDKKTYYVLPDYNGVLRALNSDEIRTLKKLRVMDKKVTILDLLVECKYSTMEKDRFLVLYSGGSYVWFTGSLEDCIIKYKNKATPSGNDVKIYAGCTPIATVGYGKFERH